MKTQGKWIILPLICGVLVRLYSACYGAVMHEWLDELEEGTTSLNDENAPLPQRHFRLAYRARTLCQRQSEEDMKKAPQGCDVFTTSSFLSIARPRLRLTTGRQIRGYCREVSVMF